MIFLSEFIKLSDSKWQPMSTHHMPFDPIYGLNKTQIELESIGILVDEIPQPFLLEGKIVSAMFINPQTKEIWYEYIDELLTPEQELEIFKHKVKEQEQQLAATNTDLAALMELVANIQGGV